MRTTIESASEADYDEIIDVWEASVRATHHFLPESDIEFFKPLIRNQYLQVVSLSCVRSSNKRIAGFMGLSGPHIEMLFLHPDSRGKGIGKTLLQHAIKNLGATYVDVNEQNEQAVGFYLHEGFEVTKRSPLDPLGKPYPILHMQLKK